MTASTSCACSGSAEIRRAAVACRPSCTTLMTSSVAIKLANAPYGLGPSRWAARTVKAYVETFITDVADREVDRHHPLKQQRPVASGAFSPASAIGLAAGLFVVALVLAALAGWELVILVAGYAALQIGYTLWFKHEPVVDLAAVS